MNKDLFEKALKDNLPNSATDFDVDAAWEALEARRKKPRRRVIFWYFAGAMLLLCGIIGWRWTVGNPKSALAASEITAHRSIESTPVTKGNNNINPVSPVNSPNGTTAAVDASKDLPQNKAEHRELLLKNEKTGVGHRTVNTAILKSKVSPKAEQMNHQAEVIESPLTSKNMAEQNPVAILEKLPNTYPIIVLKAAPALEPILLPVNVVAPPSASEPIPALDNIADKKKHTAKASNWWLGAHATYGSNFVKRQGASAYVDARAEEELPLDLIQVALNLRRRLKGNWFIEAGIQLAQWTDVRRYTALKEHTETAPNLLLMQIIQANGDVQEVYGPGTVVVRQQVSSESYNRYQYFELPLMVGKAFPISENWQLDLSAGGIIGLGLGNSGTASIDPDDMPLKDLPYRKAGLLSVQARMSLMYRTKLGDIGFSVSGRSGINSQTKPGAVFEEKRGSLGLGLLLRRSF